MVLSVLVLPCASRDEVVGWQDRTLKIRIAAPAIEGKANEALIKFLAKKLNLAPSLIVIEKGMIGKRKRLSIPLAEEDLRFVLG